MNQGKKKLMVTTLLKITQHYCKCDVHEPNLKFEFSPVKMISRL